MCIGDQPVMNPWNVGWMDIINNNFSFSYFNLGILLYGYLYSASHRRLFRGALSVTGIPIQFLLRQAFADDEASTRLLQILLFLLLSTASLMFIPCAVRSSLTFYHVEVS